MIWKRYWIIMDKHRGTPMVFDERVPVYWRRRVAQDASNDHGLTYHGPDADVEIRRCSIRMEARRT